MTSDPERHETPPAPPSAAEPSPARPAEPERVAAEARPPKPGEEDAAPKKHRSFWRELPVLIVLAFGIALIIKTFLLQAFFIPSASMEPTLMVGDRVLVEKVTYRVGEPDRGEVVVFERDLGELFNPQATEDDSFWDDVGDAFRGLFGFPTGSAQDFIKRVIAVGGDQVEGKDGRVFVNGEPVAEPYLPDGTETSDFGPIEVPDGEIFVMGDNRSNSDDSRNFGPVPVDSVVGRALLSIWPPRDFGTL